MPTPVTPVTPVKESTSTWQVPLMFQRIFRQAEVVKGTPHEDGLCSSAVNTFAEEQIKNHKTSFVDGSRSEALSTMLRMHDRQMEDVRDGGTEVEAFALTSTGTPYTLTAKASLGLKTSEEVSGALTQPAALITFPVKTFGSHQVFFRRDALTAASSYPKCTLFDPNRGVAKAPCKDIYADIAERIRKNSPDELPTVIRGFGIGSTT